MKKIIVCIIAFSASLFSAYAQLPNAGFEGWDSATVVNGIRIYNPQKWTSRNVEMAGVGKDIPVSLTTDAHSGSYAVKITSTLDDNEKYAGVLASGENTGLDLSQMDKGEKFKLTGKIKSFSAWYKYKPASSLDSFRVYLLFFLGGQNYGSAYYTGGATDTYQQFTWTLSYPDNIPKPDSAKFVIMASTYDGNEGTELILDDLDVQYKTTTGIEEAKKEAKLSVYPNPAVDHITLFGIPPKVRAVLVANSHGAIVKDKVDVNDEIQIGDLKPGLYWLLLQDEAGVQSTIKFNKL